MLLFSPPSLSRFAPPTFKSSTPIRLISIGAPVDGLDDEYGDWDTALQLAVLFANTDAVEALIAAGCDVRKINKIGETALQQAKFRSHKEIEKMILETGV